MSLQITVNNSLMRKLEEVNEISNAEARRIGSDIVKQAIKFSPVDTGSYVESFSVVTRGSGGGRSRSSKGRARGQNPEAVKARELSRLLEELNAIPDITDGFTLRNRSPHSNVVEHGGPNWKANPDGYKVFTKLRDIFR